MPATTSGATASSRPWAWPPSTTEPERLAQQVRPEALSLLSVDNASTTPSPAAAAPSTPAPAATPAGGEEPAPAPRPAQAAGQPTSCLVATGIEDRHAEALRRGLIARSPATNGT